MVTASAPLKNWLQRPAEGTCPEDEDLFGSAPVIVREPLNIILVELAKCDLEDPTRAAPRTRHSMGFSLGDEELITNAGHIRGLADLHLEAASRETHISSRSRCRCSLRLWPGFTVINLTVETSLRV